MSKHPLLEDAELNALRQQRVWRPWVTFLLVLAAGTLLSGFLPHLAVLRGWPLLVAVAAGVVTDRSLKSRIDRLCRKRARRRVMESGPIQVVPSDVVD